MNPPAPTRLKTRRSRGWSRGRDQLFWGLVFLLPNILGLLAFTAIPLVFSLVMAFTDWDLTLHNPLRRAESPQPIAFVGLSNFVELLNKPQFGQYVGNTLFFMMGMPFAIAASLLVAMLLSRDLGGGSKRTWLWLLSLAGMVAGSAVLAAVGLGATAIVILIVSLTALILLGGVAGRTTTYRTLLYLPHFTAGVATFLLWKKLYNPTVGPLTTFLQPPLSTLGRIVESLPQALFIAVMYFSFALAVLVAHLSLRKLRDGYLDGDTGPNALILPLLLTLLPAALTLYWLFHDGFAWRTGAVGLVVLSVLVMLHHAWQTRSADQTFVTGVKTLGVGGALMLGATAMVAQFILIGLGCAAANLPRLAADGGSLQPPDWLSSVDWAKPSIMIMGFWAAVGSNTMLLYLAALTNVPQDLYEAADIDGASPFQRFWNVTWPQLAPTTFFVVVMGVIGGLQGGFEMARVMTHGGPAGATTTIAYYIYTEGFEIGRLGFASAVAWTLFLMVLIVTLINWRFGNRYVND